MSDETLKSAYELAMEKLREKDPETGGIEGTLSDAQKEAITEARNACEAKLAEMEILYRSKRAGTADAEAERTLLQEYRRDVRRVTDDRDRKIERIRKSGP